MSILGLSTTTYEKQQLLWLFLFIYLWVDYFINGTVITEVPGQVPINIVRSEKFREMLQGKIPSSNII